MAESNVEQMVKDYATVASLAEEILADKQQVVDLDGKRNKAREAVRKLKKLHPSLDKQSSKTWVCFGETFLKMDTGACIEMLETDQETISKEIMSLRDGLKPKVERLHLLEGRAKVKGFDLKGMKAEDLAFVS